MATPKEKDVAVYDWIYITMMDLSYIAAGRDLVTGEMLSKDDMCRIAQRNVDNLTKIINDNGE